MEEFGINTEKAINSAQEIMGIAANLQRVHGDIGNISLNGVLDGKYVAGIENTIKQIVESVSVEALKMNSLGDALEVIVNKYQETEKAVAKGETVGNGSSESASTRGTDKRKWWQKIWDWITRNEPDEYDTTNDEQEKAANNAMKKKLWNVLQDEKYSQQHWDSASLEERKQILQDYMNEVIAIYGLRDVKATIKWDSTATYTNNSVTWGYYTHSYHSVTLNERVLTDRYANWDSYELLETVSHELRHAYQHEAVDHPTRYMVSKETIDAWRYNFKHYINSDDDYNGYRAQIVEVDARDFQVSRDDFY